MAYYRMSDISGASFEAAVTSTGILPVRRPGVIADDVATILCVQSSITFPSGTNPALNDVLLACILPADHVPVGFWANMDQFDSNATPTFKLQVGLMTGTFGDTARTQTAVGSEGGTYLCGGTNGLSYASATATSSPDTIAAGMTPTAIAASSVIPLAVTTLHRIAPSSTADREIGLAIAAAAATNPATARRLDFQLWMRVSRYAQ